MPRFDGGDESRVQALMVEREQEKINAWINDQEVRRLEAENERLREALSRLVSWWDANSDMPEEVDFAREALDA